MKSHVFNSYIQFILEVSIWFFEVGSHIYPIYFGSKLFNSRSKHFDSLSKSISGLGPMSQQTADSHRARSLLAWECVCRQANANYTKKSESKTQDRSFGPVGTNTLTSASCQWGKTQKISLTFCFLKVLSKCQSAASPLYESKAGKTAIEITKMWGIPLYKQLKVGKTAIEMTKIS